MLYPSKKFRQNPFTSLRVIRRTDRQTNRQTNRQTDRTKNITSFFGGGNYCRTVWPPETFKQGRGSGAPSRPIPSEPVFEVRKQTLQGSYYVHCVSKQFETVWQHCCDEYVCVSARMFVLSQNSNTIPPYFTTFCMLPVTMARSSADSVVIRYELPVLWMTSCLHTMGPMGQKQAQRYV